MRVAVTTTAGSVLDMNLPATPAWEGDEPWYNEDTLAAVFLSPTRYRAVVQLHTIVSDEDEATDCASITFLLMEGPDLDQLRTRFPAIDAALQRARVEDL